MPDSDVFRPGRFYIACIESGKRRPGKRRPTRDLTEEYKETSLPDPFETEQEARDEMKKRGIHGTVWQCKPDADKTNDT
jgi:hypothetical protein